MLIKSQKKVWLTFLAILIFFSTVTQYAFAAISVPPNSTDSSTPLTVTPTLDGSSTWYFDGYTEVVNSNTNSSIGNTYRYKSSRGTTVTMINPGNIGDWVDAFGGESHQVIADYSSGKIPTYHMAPPSPKTAYDRLKIDDIISASAVTSEYKNGKIYVKAPGDAPKITKFAVKEKPANEKGCYPIKKAINIEIEVEQSDEKAPLKYVEVYAKDKNSASILKKWDNVQTSNGKASLTVPYEVTMKEEVSFYVRAYDSRNRFDIDTQGLNLTVGSIKPVGLNFKICGVVTSEVDPDGTLPYFNHGTLLKEDNLAGGAKLKRVDDTVGEHVLGRYRYPTLYDGKYGGTLLDRSTMSNLNTSFTVEVPFKNTGADRSKISAAYKGQAFYHLVTENVTTARNVIDVDRVTMDDFKKVYNGNPDYMKTAVKVRTIEDAKTRYEYGKYYYIRDLAFEAGGLADNVTGSDEFNSINPTWLRVLRTDWPDIVTFKLNQPKVKIGDTVSFTMDGYEYVSEKRNKADTTITITKADGSQVGAPIKTNLKSDKSKKNKSKPNQAEAGYWGSEKVQGPQITEKGLYTAELYMEDEVKRFASKKITFAVGCEEGDSSEECNENPPGEYGSCSFEYTVEEAEKIESTPEHIKANPVGKITEDKNVPTSAVFDVLKYGIATDEYLKVWGKSNRFLSDYKFQQYKGKIKYKIKVDKTYNRSWTKYVSRTCHDEDGPYDCSYEVPQSDTVHKEMSFDDVYDYSYWQIGHLIIYKLDDLTFENYALPSGKVIVMNDRHETVADAIHSDIWEDHVFPKLCNNVTLPSSSLSGGYSPPPVPDETDLFKSAAKLGSRIPDVKNDSVKIKISSKDVQKNPVSEKETVHMDDKKTPSHGPTPKEITVSDIVDLEMSKQYIDKEKVNKYQTTSSITAKYSPIIEVNKAAEPSVSFTNTSNDTVDGEKAINPVTVHTPVVMYAKASDDKEHDQRIKPPTRSTPANPDTDRHAFVLDRPFTVSLPTVGQHLNEPGYGNRDFAKYYKDKQIKFPFDVYTETKQGFYPKNTWISVPIEMETVTFFLPVWVPEGEYTLEYRAIAINAPDRHVSSNSPTEPEANLNLNFRTPDAMMDNHIATDKINVDVIGRLYDLHITDITDYNWKSAFRQSDGVTPNNNSYWVGLNGIDGDKRGNNNPFVLPVRHGSHPDGYQNVAVKTGYKFRFDIKTKGDMESIKDAIRITPRFYHVSKDGRNRQPVDLYYHDDNNYFVKIGSDKDKTYRTVSLNETLRNVPKNELANNASHYYNFADRFNLEETKNEYYETAFARNYIKNMSKEPIQTGPYGWQILNWKLRTYRGPLENQVPQNTMIPPKEIVSKEQTWYSEYSLPAKLYVVPQNSSVQEAGRVEMLNENHPLFLNNGYIIVNFDIETIQEGDVNNPYLRYYDAYYMSQWTDMEGFTSNFVDSYGNNFNLEEGDMIFYHADQSSLDDFKSSVTH